MARTLKENLQLLGILKEPEPAPDEVDGIDFAWWPTCRLIEYAMKHWDAMSEDTQDGLVFEIKRRISEAYENPEGSEAAV